MAEKQHQLFNLVHVIYEQTLIQRFTPSTTEQKTVHMLPFLLTQW